MMGYSVMDILAPLIFGVSCGLAFQQLRRHFRDRRIRRITARLIE